MAHVLAQPQPGFRWRSAAKELVRAGVERSPLSGRFFWRLSQPVAALTFDDGPDPEQTPRILDLLGEWGAHATFFVLGEAASKHPRLVCRITAEGHAIGNHTYSHAVCRGISAAELRTELAATDAAIREACGVEPRLFRPPFGAVGLRSLCALARDGRRVALWSQDSRDYRGAGPEEIAAVGAALRPRDILLLHDRFPATVEALPRILRSLRERGVPLVTLEAPEARRKEND
ncbi:MAG: polysaccharide deacetylase family protein [Armatimonadota bacterium]